MTGWKIVISYYDGSWRPALCKLEIPEGADIVCGKPRVSLKPSSLFMKNNTTGEIVQLSDVTDLDLTPCEEPIKCRCSKAKVIGLYCYHTPFGPFGPITLDELVPLHGEGFSIHEIANMWNGLVHVFPLEDMVAKEMAIFLFDSNDTWYPRPTKYAPGNVITPHDFDPSSYKECAPGIHFFVEFVEAIRYAAIPDGVFTSYPLQVCDMLNDIKVVPPESNS